VSGIAGRDRMRSALLAWAGVGLVAFALLPWHLAADKTLVESLRAVFSAVLMSRVHTAAARP